MRYKRATWRTTRALLFVLCTASYACTTQLGDSPEPLTQAEVGALPAGIEEYVPLPYMSQVPFLVIEATSIGNDDFDIYLRDELVRAGFPKAILKSQLASVYINAGLTHLTSAINDPIGLHKLSGAVGPFLLVRVKYTPPGWTGAPYRVVVWDARSASPVFVMKGKQMIWKNMNRELGQPIVQMLTKWRNDSLQAERSAAGELDREST